MSVSINNGREPYVTIESLKEGQWFRIVSDGSICVRSDEGFVLMYDPEVTPKGRNWAKVYSFNHFGDMATILVEVFPAGTEIIIVQE